MCGIVGYSTKKPAVLDLEKALDFIGHRGPDARGVLVNETSKLGFGHVRLSIIDPQPTGNQPMLSDDGRISLIYNGEIYNFESLREDLISKGYTFRGTSDSEVLLNLLHHEGTRCLAKLNGIFAFAFFDNLTGEITIVRDALGVKPLYLGTDENGTYFSSEIKGLVGLGFKPAQPDAAALDRYLTYLWCPGNGTPVKNIRKVNPGELVIVKHGIVVRQSHWASPRLPAARKSNDSVRNLVERTRNALRSAVHRQLISDAPLGAFLSGGLDSSAVVAFARELKPELPCFTIETADVANDGFPNDLPFAKAVARHLDVPLHTVKVTANDIEKSIRDLVWQLDEPLADPAAINVMIISRLARQKEIKVLLSGTGGDDVFSGYSRHKAVRFQNIVSLLPKPILQRIQAFSRNGNQNNSFFRRLSKFADGITRPEHERLVNYFAWARREDLQQVYSQSFKAALASEEASTPMLLHLQGFPPSADPIERILELEKRFFLADHNLIYTDKMSMASGVEVRVPFLDNEVLAVAAEIPAAYKQRGSVGKWILKKAMEPLLPRNVIYRPKAGFGVPLRRWMRFELRELLENTLSEANINERGYFNYWAIQKMISDNDTGRIDASYTLLSLMMIELWFQKFCDE